jgi:hypothetical protein
MTKSFKQYPQGAERPVTRTFKSNMVFSGLIDEVTMFNSELGEDKIKSFYKTQEPKRFRQIRPYALPAGDQYASAFGANYTKLKFHKAWDGLWRVGRYADIVVNFAKQPWRFVFWRGTRYMPSLVTDYGRSGIWSNDQSPEIYIDQCYEHMSDMLCRFSNVRLISSSPARVVVHWRNASVNIEYRWPGLDDNGWGVWTDEYWTIYPDGTSVRHQILHNRINANVGEMNQNEILHHPGQTTEDILLNDAVVLGNENGEFQIWYRQSEEPDRMLEGNKNLLYTNLNSSTKQFQIGEIGTDIRTHLRQDLYWNGWDHYPVQLIPSDGTRVHRYDRTVVPNRLIPSDGTDIYRYDRAASTCPSTFMEYRRKIDKTTTEAMQIYGLTQSKPEDLTPLNRSWNFSPQITAKSGCVGLEFNKGEKAYYLRQEADTLQFQISATKNSPLVNPAFVIKNFDGNSDNVEVKINDHQVDWKRGIELDTGGHPMLVIWIEYRSKSSTDFKILTNQKSDLSKR